MFALWKLILDHVEELYGIMDLTKTARDVKNSFMEVSINMSLSISIPLFIDIGGLFPIQVFSASIDLETWIFEECVF